MTYYHGSTETLTTDSLREGVLCVTDDSDAALEYGPVLHTVELPSLYLADGQDIVRMAREIDEDCPYTSAWECIEEVDGVLERLQAEGYEGARYEDHTLDAATDHMTIMLWDARRVVRIERVEG